MYRLLTTKRLFSTYNNVNTVGFIGLGQMGARMAKNLIRKGYNVVVSDVSAAATAEVSEFAKANNRTCIVATKPCEIASKANVIVTMLPNSKIVQDVYCGKDGILSTASKDSLFIDSSTIDPTTVQEISKLAAKQSCTLVDAPVSGGVKGAEEGTLTFMVGGNQTAFDNVQPFLKSMGRNIVHVGDVGLGQVAKICNNLVLGISMVGISEAYNMGIQLGMEPAKLANIFNTSTARCWASDTYNPVPGVLPNVPASREYQGGFAVNLMKKDLGLALDAAKSKDLPLVMGPVVSAFYENMSKEGYGNLDMGAAYKYLQEKSKKN